MILGYETLTDLLFEPLSDADFETLTDYLVPNYDDSSTGIEYRTGAIKETDPRVGNQTLAIQHFFIFNPVDSNSGIDSGIGSEASSVEIA